MYRIKGWIAAATMLGLVAPLHAQDKGAGKSVYEKTCSLCHASGLAGAPKLGSTEDWASRLKAGLPRLYQSALHGTPKGMPAKGGNLALSDADVKAAVDYIVRASGGVAKPPAPQAAQPKSDKAAATPVPHQTQTDKPAPASAAAVPVAAVPAAEPPQAYAAVAVTAPLATSANPNNFNRLLAAPGARNPPPSQDGIHDPGNAGTRLLQPPQAAYQGLPAGNAGNRVNWVAALDKKGIQPRWDALDAKAEAMVMDLNIVREVKGSMPDVVYPHKQHTQWLDCSNCHPAIFIPQKGANQISMASILMGEKCGACHGRVAFPVSECRLCHSKKKDQPAQSASGSSRPGSNP
jgi:c(7)-type cytochrome triheme protein